MSDDNLVPKRFYDILRNRPRRNHTRVIMVNANRGDGVASHHGTYTLVAAPPSMRAGCVDLGQMIVREDVMCRYRFPAGDGSADGNTIARIVAENRGNVEYWKELRFFFNALEPGRFRRVPE
jgi:hypothetical protein